MQGGKVEAEKEGIGMDYKEMINKREGKVMKQKRRTTRKETEKKKTRTDKEKNKIQKTINNDR